MTMPQVGAEAALREGQGNHNNMTMVLSKESNQTRLHGSVGIYYQHTSD